MNTPMPDSGEYAGPEPIAIVGLACRLPGARDADEFWRNLTAGVESLQSFTREEQLAAGVAQRHVDDPSFVSAAMVLDDMEYLDAALFGLTSREAEVRDPQQRLFLELAHTALEDAGYDPARYDGDIGVYGGIGADEYQWRNIRRNPQVFAAAGALAVATGNHPDYLATFTAYKLNLRGPAVTVHTACSSSLVAMHLAVEALRNGECDMALSGAASIELPHRAGYVYDEGGINSPDGHCRAFDAGAAGTVWGSGGGVVVLRRLSDALADGDHIRAVIRGNAINNDGSDKVGFSAPSVDGQVAVIANALGVAAVDPRTVSYVEAHGTGTALGDPIEVAALATVFGQNSADTGWCALASVKTNIGHLGPAAGVAGVIKTVLAMEHGLIPPIVNFEKPHEKIDFASSPFYVNTTLSRWTSVDGQPRRAGVSSFGIGGTNAHLILEEAPPAAAALEDDPGSPAGSRERRAHLVQVSARTEVARAASVTRLAERLSASGDLDLGGVDLGDVAYTLRSGRKARPIRAAVVAGSVSDAAAALADRKRLITGSAGARPPRVAFLFSGQGSQYAGMGAQLYRCEPAFAAAVDECAEILRPELGRDLREPMFAAGDRDADALLGQTEFTQPALFVVEYALAALWRSWGIEPDAMIGHSIGEYVAATLAGVFPLADALRLVATRGRLMQSMPPGAMLAVTLDELEVRDELPPDLSIATVNGPGTCVVAGPTEAVSGYAATLAERGVGSKALRTSHAFHSPMMDPILGAFREAVAAAGPAGPARPFLSNVTGELITAEQASDPSYWANHLRETVRFNDCVRRLLDDGDWILLEVGPGRQLAGLTRRHLTRDAVPPLSSLPPAGDARGDLATIYDAAARIWVNGGPVEVTPAAGGRRVSLPTYPYERKKYWVDPVAQADSMAPERTGPRALPDWFATPAWRQAEPAERARFQRCLFFGDGPVADAVVARLRGDGVDVTQVGIAREARFGDACAIRPDRRDDIDALLVHLGPDRPDRIIHGYALDGEPSDGDPARTWNAQNRGFFSVLALAQALAAAEPAGGDRDGALGAGTPDGPAPVQLDLLTDRTQDVTGDDLHRPEHATVGGAVRVLPLEMPWLSVRQIDVDARRRAVADDAVAELFARTGDDQLVLRGGRRWTQAWAPAKADGDPALALPPGGVCLITGGLGGIGITVAEDLAVRLGARVVLVSRGGLPDRAEWDEYVAVHGVRDRVGRAIAAIRRVEEAASAGGGGQVVAIAADVSSTPDMCRVRDEVLERFGQIDVIVHAAGVPGDGMAEVKEREQAEAVMAPKLLGTLALRAAFGHLSLRAVVLCSSITGIAGGFGQIDYCGANAFMDAFARGDHGFNARVVSLNWGGWLDVGMAAEVAAPDAFRARQRGVVSTPMDHPVLSAVHRDPATDNAYATGIIGPGTHWVLDEHRINGSPVMPGTGHLDTVRAAAVAAFGPAHPGMVAELRDVVFIEPMAVPDGGRAELRVAFTDGGDGLDFNVSSQAGGVVRAHVRGTIGWVPEQAPPVHDLAAIKERCRISSMEPDPAHSHSGMLSFGPRWSSLRRVHTGVDEELAWLEAGDLVAGEAGSWTLHPALLDEATSFGTSRGDGRYLPMGYGRLCVRGPLPARFWSHLTYRGDASATDLIVADLALIDADGNEIVTISDFTLRRIDVEAVGATVAAGATTDAGTSAGPATDTGDLAYTKATAANTDTVGIAPADGAEALRLMLATDLGPQVTVTVSEVSRIIASVRTINQSTVESELGSVTAGAAERVASGDYVAPRTELEQTLCALWSSVLGAGQVGVTDDFFDLGGNSLVAVQLIASVRKAVGAKLPMRSLFEAPTVAGMAAAVDRVRATADPGSATAPEPTIPTLARRS